MRQRKRPPVGASHLFTTRRVTVCAWREGIRRRTVARIRTAGHKNATRNCNATQVVSHPHFNQPRDHLRTSRPPLDKYVNLGEVAKWPGASASKAAKQLGKKGSVQPTAPSRCKRIPVVVLVWRDDKHRDPRVQQSLLVPLLPQRTTMRIERGCTRALAVVFSRDVTRKAPGKCRLWEVPRLVRFVLAPTGHATPLAQLCLCALPGARSMLVRAPKTHLLHCTVLSRALAATTHARHGSQSRLTRRARWWRHAAWGCCVGLTKRNYHQLHHHRPSPAI